MDAFSTSFLFPLVSKYPKISTSLITFSSSPNIPLLHISSVIRIEDERPQTTSNITTATRKTTLKERHSPPQPTISSSSSFPNNFFNAIDDFINTSLDPPLLPPWINPKIVLSNNFAPVDELPPTPCEVVEGSLPPCLDGAYIRNGPNPHLFPRGAYHLFDGDGMLHSLKISNGKATFCSRFVKTNKYISERKTGSPVIPSLLAGFYSPTAFTARCALSVARRIAGQFNMANGFGLANTSLALFGGHLYALGESDLPYSIKLDKNGDIVTIGRHDFDGMLLESMTAHPKMDPETGETFAFRYGLAKPPYLTFFRISALGEKEPDVPIFSVRRPSFLHDVAITKRYAIFPDIQIVLNPSAMIAGRSPVGSDPGKVPRLGVIPRYAMDESEMKWFDAPGLNFIHAINAWDEDDGDSIVILAPNILSVEHILERMDLTHGSIEKIKIDLKTGMVWRHPVSTRNLELGVINPAYVGRKNNPFVDPKIVLSNNFAPVEELPPPCEVEEGSLPPCLDGAYIRNGPIPLLLPRGPYHLFDGDGMLHSLKISNGKATFCSRFVKTSKYISEKRIGSSVIPYFFAGFHSLTAFTARWALSIARMLAGQFNMANGFGLANTSLALFRGHLYALGESDLPYSIKLAKNGDIITIGSHDFDGMLLEAMSAHPKMDRETGETFAFRYGLSKQPYLTFFRISALGEKELDVQIFSTERPSLLHDFAIIKKYAIFPDIQIGIKPFAMIAGGSPVGSDPRKVLRLGVIPRYAKDESEMKWFDVPGLNFLHAINAWDGDDGYAIVILGANILSIEHMFERVDLIHGSVEKIKSGVKTGIVWRHPVSTRNLEFGVINPGYVGKKNKYVYAAVGDPMPRISGVVKLDISVSEGDRRDCVVASRLYEPGCFGGEPFFVAKEPNNPHADEDDGYVVSYVHDENKGESRFLVMDAKSPNLDVVAAVKLPQRVPSGFHGLFVRESDLNSL